VREVDGRVRGDVTDSLVGDAFGLLVGADAVDDSMEQELLGVGAIAGEEDAVIAVLDDDPDMARAVAGQRLFG
jgi:hypothetical protein